MAILIDTHVHIYPFYDSAAAIDASLANMNRIDPHATRILCLAERYDCRFFADVGADQVTAISRSFEVARTDASTILKLTRHADGEEVHLVAGQQIVTEENIELLALDTTDRVDEGCPAIETVEQILKRNAIPVVAWAPGKWFTSRGETVQRMLETFTPDQLGVGDTSLRPRGWGTPLLMSKAMRGGFRRLCGSDPLPFSGEEQRLGSYLTRISDDAGQLSPKEAIADLLGHSLKVETAGRRGSPWEVFRRLSGNERVRRRAREVTN